MLLATLPVLQARAEVVKGYIPFQLVTDIVNSMDFTYCICRSATWMGIPIKQEHTDVQPRQQLHPEAFDFLVLYVYLF